MPREYCGLTHMAVSSSVSVQDCLVNLSFKADHNGHICEIQLVHKKLMLARAGMVSNCSCTVADARLVV